jgi:hypothetical protein
MLPGRTDNAVKNRFHATERARNRQAEKGLTPVTDTDGSVVYPSPKERSPKRSLTRDTAETDTTDFELDDNMLAILQNSTQSDGSDASDAYQCRFVPIKREQRPPVPTLDQITASQRQYGDMEGNIFQNQAFVHIPQPYRPSENDRAIHNNNYYQSYGQGQNNLHEPMNQEVNDVDLSFLHNDKFAIPTPMMISPRTFCSSPESVPDIDDIDFDWLESHLCADLNVPTDPFGTNQSCNPNMNMNRAQNHSIGCGSINISSQFNMLHNMCGFNI